MFNQNVLITTSSQIVNNRNYSKSIIGSNGGSTNDTTNNNNKNIPPKNLNSNGADKFGGNKQGNGNGKDGLPCPKCGHLKCVSVDLAGKFLICNH